MNTKEAADFLKVSISRIIKMIDSKKLPAEKVNGQWKIKKNDLKKIVIRTPGRKEYSVKLVLRKFTRGEKGSASFIEAKSGKSGYGKMVKKIELNNIRPETIEKIKNEMIQDLEKGGYQVFCDF